MKEMRWERKGEKDHWRHPERRVQVRLEAKGNARSSGQAYYRVELSRSPKFTKDQKDVVAKFDRRGRPQPRGPKDVPLGRFMDLPVAQKMRQVDGNMSRTHEPLPRMPADARGRARAKAVLAELSGRADRRQEVSKAWAGRAETLREAARKRRAAREQGREKGSRGKSR